MKILICVMWIHISGAVVQLYTTCDMQLKACANKAAVTFAVSVLSGVEHFKINHCRISSVSAEGLPLF